MKSSKCVVLGLVATIGMFLSPFAVAVNVSIDVGNYIGQWDMDIDGNFASGSRTLDLAPGLHRIRPGTVAQVLFNVDASGNVTLAPEYDGISATGGAGTLNLLTVPVQIDPGDYDGKWEISRVSGVKTGNRTVRLVPTEQTNQDGSIGGEYLLSFGLASSAVKVNLRADGSKTFSDGNNAFAGAVFDDFGVLKFRNTNITVTDRDVSGLSWIINQVTPSFGEPGTPSGNQTVTVVPEVEYQFQAGASVTWFTVSDPCAVNPGEQDIGGVFFDVTCGVEPGFFAVGNLFVADSNVKVYDASGVLVGEIDAPELDQSGDIEFNYVRDLLYVADRQGGDVFVFDSGGNVAQIISPAPGETVAWGTAIDAAGTAYVVGAGGRINVFDNDGTYLRTISGAFTCCGIQAALSPDGNTLYVTETSGFGKGIHAWDLANNDTYLGFIGDTGSAFSLTDGIATGPDGTIYVGDGGVVPGTGALVKVSPDGFVQSTIATGLNAPFGIAVDAANQVWVAEANEFVTGQDKIFGFDSNGSPVGSLAPYPEVGQPVGLEFYLPPPPAPVLDQANEPLPVNCSTTLGASVIEPPAFSQTITVGATGLLSRIDFSIQRPSDYDAGDLSLEIRNVESIVYQGQTVDAPGSALLGTKTITPAELLPFPTDQTGLVEIDISNLGINVDSGDQISIVFTRAEYTGSGGKSLIFYCSGGTVGDPDGFYVGGRAWHMQAQVGEWTPFNSWIDFRFRTYVSGVENNEAPTADAGADQSIRAGDTVMLDGSASFDDNTSSANLAYAWSFASLPIGSSASLSDASSVAPSFVADIADTFIVELVVTDEGGLASVADDIVIGSDNLAPTANAGDDQLVIVGTTVSLDAGGSSDPELDTLSFQWTISTAPAGSIAALTNANAPMASLTPDVDGIYELALDVSDAIGLGTPDTAQITATTAETFSEVQIVTADVVVVGLSAGQVTTSGNQNALSNFLDQAVAAIQEGDIPEAIDKLEKALTRTDGCILRGSPDGNGKGRDWIIDCSVQLELYDLLNAARSALDTP